MSDLNELVITEDDYRQFLKQRLRLKDSQLAEEVETVGFPFLLTSGSELLRSFILSETGFISTLPDRLKMPDRGYAWYMFSQAVKEIHADPKRMHIRYQLQDDYKRPFKRFYI
ncbi:MAG: hypothetical protein U9N48_04815 [Euryarchaeota archaeon]|nr:hypothetical protein [Euryarchaeota archaeon]